MRILSPRSVWTTLSDTDRASRCLLLQLYSSQCRTRLGDSPRFPATYDIASRKLLDFVGAQAGIKWVLFEDKKRLACATLLLRGQLSEASPERASRAESIFHLSPGYGSFSAVSRFTNRPASASAIPGLKDSGIQESSFSTTNLAIAYPRRFTLITHCPVLAPASIAALPSTPAISDRRCSMSFVPVTPFTVGLRESRSPLRNLSQRNW